MEGIGFEIEEMFRITAELFHADDQRRRDAAFHFFRDVWQVNRLWRAFHDPDNPQQEVVVVARLLGFHRNTITGKMRQLGLSADNFRAADSVVSLISQSQSLRTAQLSLLEMMEEDSQELDQIAQ